jgi:hypothetical protein
MTIMTKRFLETSALGFVLALSASPAFAVETGMSPYLKGFSGFMSGYVPTDSGLYLSDVYYYDHGTAGAEVRNGNVELGVDMTLNADLLQATYVTDAKIMGGTYAVSVAGVYAWADLSASVDTPLGALNLSESQDGFSDSLVAPLILGWHEGNFHWNVAALFLVPTGSYDPHELSVGRNIWAAMPQFSLTWFDPQSGWDLSAAVTYVSQSKNDATNYKSGDIMNVDWAIGDYFGGGAWEAGVAGNIVQQIGADRGSGAKLGPFKEQSFGLGPALSYSTKLGSVPTSLSAKWEHDIDTHNTFEGDVVTVSATVSF